MWDGKVGYIMDVEVRENERGELRGELFGWCGRVGRGSVGWGREVEEKYC